MSQFSAPMDATPVGGPRIVRKKHQLLEGQQTLRVSR